MVKHKLDIETYWADGPPNAAVRIRRHDDDKYFDWHDAKFKPEEGCKLLNIPLKATNHQISIISIDPDPKEWAEGGYTIYYFDVSVPNEQVYYMKTIYFPLCDPTTAEVAGRTLDAVVSSHKLPKSVGAYLIDIVNRLDKIEQKINAKG